MKKVNHFSFLQDLLPYLNKCYGLLTFFINLKVKLSVVGAVWMLYF